MLKISENPPMLPAAVERPADLVGTWWVAHTKARNEKALAWDLYDRSIAHYLPMVSRTAFSGGRKRKVLSPVFPSYVFFLGSDETRLAVFGTDRICQVLPVKDQQALVRELQSLHQAIESKLELDMHPFAAVGRRCRVARGPLMGIEGTVIRRDNITRLVLQVGMLGRGAAIEIDADVLEPVE